MKKYKYVTVVLAYRNMKDLKNSIKSISEMIPQNRTIIVNSYYNDETLSEASDIANEFDCDFLNVENKGYSYGNNVGISWALNHYEFDYIIISNPDINIEKFDDISIYECDADIIAPNICTISGKKQNPMMFRENKLAENLIYRGLKTNQLFFYYLGVAMKRISREINLFINRNNNYPLIYEAHGSFMIFSLKAITELGRKPYDENMFLFAEESVIAIKAKRLGLVTKYTRDIQITHFVDGSIQYMKNEAKNESMRKSNVYVFENYIK